VNPVIIIFVVAWISTVLVLATAMRLNAQSPSDGMWTGIVAWGFVFVLIITSAVLLAGVLSAFGISASASAVSILNAHPT
jgi:hypothetical protein